MSWIFLGSRFVKFLFSPLFFGSWLLNFEQKTPHLSGPFPGNFLRRTAKFFPVWIPQCPVVVVHPWEAGFGHGMASHGSISMPGIILAVFPVPAHSASQRAGTNSSSKIGVVGGHWWRQTTKSEVKNPWKCKIHEYRAHFNLDI